MSTYGIAFYSPPTPRMLQCTNHLIQLICWEVSSCRQSAVYFHNRSCFLPAHHTVINFIGKITIKTGHRSLFLMQRYFFFCYWSFVIYEYGASVSMTRSVTHFHSIPGKWPLCAKTCHPTDKLISLFPIADWLHLTLGFFFHVKRCEMRHLKLIKEGKITKSYEATVPLRWLCSTQLVGYSTWLTEGVLDPRSSTPPTHTLTKQQGAECGSGVNLHCACG